MIDLVVFAIAAASGSILGFIATNRILEREVNEAKSLKMTTRVNVISEFLEKEGVKKLERGPPKSLEELVEYVAARYMLTDVTMLTNDGLVIASNSKTPESDAAIAPEIMKVIKSVLDVDKAVLSSGDKRVLVAQLNEDIILHARVARDVSKREVESIREEV
ncbi:MAG: hypothetical protein QXI31_04940, partial [Archaeoglobaceae archaeon]